MRFKYLAFFISIMILSGGCSHGADGDVSSHFDSIVPYKSIKFEPVIIDQTRTLNYVPKSFYKLDNRFRGLRASLFVSSDSEFFDSLTAALKNSKNTDEARKALEIIGDISINLTIRDKNEKIVFSSKGALKDYKFKLNDDTGLKFNLQNKDGLYSFTPKTDQLGSIELKVFGKENAENLKYTRINLYIKEIRGK